MEMKSSNVTKIVILIMSLLMMMVSTQCQSPSAVASVSTAVSPVVSASLASPVVSASLASPVVSASAASATLAVSPSIAASGTIAVSPSVAVSPSIAETATQAVSPSIAASGTVAVSISGPSVTISPPLGSASRTPSRSAPIATASPFSQPSLIFYVSLLCTVNTTDCCDVFTGDWASLIPTNNQSALTLITCYPTGILTNVLFIQGPSTNATAREIALAYFRQGNCDGNIMEPCFPEYGSLNTGNWNLVLTMNLEGNIGMIGVSPTASVAVSASFAASTSFAVSPSLAFSGNMTSAVLSPSLAFSGNMTSAAISPSLLTSGNITSPMSLIKNRVRKLEESNSASSFKSGFLVILPLVFAFLLIFL